MAERERKPCDAYRTAVRENNPNWRGGRSITAHGYTLIRVGKDHPLADVRGYAYEHRLVAAANLGRDLKPGEEVHHWDKGDTQNNDWSNLEACANRLEHKVHHRTSTQRSRAAQMPGEDNVELTCACGCGATFLKYDGQRRAREFYPGHTNRTAMPTKSKLANAPYDEVVNLFGRMGPHKSEDSTHPMHRFAAQSWKKLHVRNRDAARYRAAYGHAQRILVNASADFFDNQADQSWRDEACIDFEKCPDVIIMLVTKRPQNVRKMVPLHWLRGQWPPHVWVLTTGENQVEFDRRVLALMDVPAPIRGVSMEPMLDVIHPEWAFMRSTVEIKIEVARRLRGKAQPCDIRALNWLIVGGESGSKARPMPPVSHVAGMVQRVSNYGASVFVKQMSQADFPKTFGDIEHFPKGLKVREHPKHV